MNCSECRERLSDVLANATATGTGDTSTWYVFLDAHLAECASCRGLARELSRQDRLLCEALSAGQVAVLAAQLERRLEAPAPRIPWRRPWLRWGLAGLAASIVVAASLLVLRSRSAKDETTAAVVETAGEVVFTESADGSGKRVGPGQGIRTVGADSRAVLRFGDASQLSLGENTTLRVLGPEAAGTPGTRKQFYLEEGSLTAEVSRQPPQAPMVLMTPGAEVTVLGTRFRLSVSVDFTLLEVEEGIVRFLDKNNGRSSEVAAGQQARAGDARSGVVSGRVRFQGVPVGRGVLTFLREDGRAASAVIDQGVYKIYKAPVGKVAVTVQSLRAGPVAIPDRYKNTATSGLTLVVEPKEQSHDFDLEP